MLTWQQNENWAHPLSGCALLFLSLRPRSFIGKVGDMLLFAVDIFLKNAYNSNGGLGTESLGFHARTG